MISVGCYGCQATDSGETRASSQQLVVPPDETQLTEADVQYLTRSVHEDATGTRRDAAGESRWTFAPTSEAELASANSSASPTQAPAEAHSVDDGKSRVLDALAASAQSSELQVVVELDGPPLPRLSNLDAQRGAEISAYTASLQPSFDAFTSKASAAGASTFGAAWLNRSIAVRGSAAALTTLIKLPEVLRASLNDGAVIEFADQDKCYAALPGNNLGIGGQSWRIGTRENLLTTYYSGDTGGRAGGRVRVAILDSGIAVKAHHAFRFAPSSPPGDRFLFAKVCSNSSCTFTSTPGALNHANPVTQWALGNVESGRDPNCSWIMGDVRSGSRAYGAHILAYDVAAGCDAARLALQDAVAQGTDIVNMSVGYFYSGACDRNHDCGALNSAIRSATDQGVLIVGAAGNTPWDGTCKVGYPQMRPEVLTVGGLDTWNRLADFNSTSLHINSSGGKMIIHMATGSLGYDTVLDLLGPYVVNFTGASALDWYANSANTRFYGTSVSAPAVAGGAARVLDGFRTIGWPQNARTLRLNMSLMGDAGDGPTQDRLFGTGYTWGYGRPHITVPAPGWATGPSWWGQSPFTLQPNVTAYGCVNGCQPMPSSVRQYNWVLFYEDPDLTWTPHVGIQVKDLDTGQVIRQDTSHSLTKRIQLRDAEIWGRRLQLVVIPYSMWGSYTMYSGDFFHSDPTGWTFH